MLEVPLAVALMSLLSLRSTLVVSSLRRNCWCSSTMKSQYVYVDDIVEFVSTSYALMYAIQFFLGCGLGGRKWYRVLVCAELMGNILGREWICQSDDAQG